MIFVITGSRSFQFNRLLKAIDDATGTGMISDSVFAQTGNSDYQIHHYQHIDYLDRDEFQEKIVEADLIVTAGGTGAIVSSAKLGKRIVAVPRLSDYGEAVDNHQVELIKAFERMGIVVPCYDCTPEQITESIEKAKSIPPTPFRSNTESIIDSIEDYIYQEFPVEKENVNKLRILMCGSDRSEKGGMNSVIDQLMDHNWGESIELSYLPTHITGTTVKKLLYFEHSFIELKRLIRKNAFDIVHLHMSYKGSFFRKYIIAKACRNSGKKIVVHLHGSEFKDFYENATKSTKKKIIELFTIADRTIVLGYEWEKFIKHIAPSSRAQIINNAVCIPHIGEKKENDIPVVLFLGALIKRKGLLDLFNAVILLRDEVDFKLLIAGEGEEQEYLKIFVKENGLSDIVQFLGWVGKSQKIELLEQSDVLVLPSHNEGLPISILEALSYALPVISTDVGSISEAVINDENGYLYQPGDIRALSSALKKIITDRSKWKLFSEKSRALAENKFSEDVFFEKVLSVYRTI